MSPYVELAGPARGSLQRPPGGSTWGHRLEVMADPEHATLEDEVLVANSAAVMVKIPSSGAFTPVGRPTACAGRR